MVLDVYCQRIYVYIDDRIKESLDAYPESAVDRIRFINEATSLQARGSNRNHCVTVVLPYLWAAGRQQRRQQTGRQDAPSRTIFCLSVREFIRNCRPAVEL